MSNERAIESLCEHDGASVFVGWLPLFHDMGLIANVLQPLYLGTASVLMPPSAFLADERRKSLARSDVSVWPLSKAPMPGIFGCFALRV